MKTPEEIVDSIPEFIDLPNANIDVSRGVIHRLAVAAVEADRAQRGGRLDDLHAYDWTPRAEDEVRSDDETPEVPILIVQIDTPANIGRVRVYINDGRIYDGDPETGEEWSLT